MTVSIVHRSGIAYPESDENYSPSERYPEYQYGHVATRPNVVYEMVRECIRQMGLDSENFGTERWNPLGEFIPKGSSVFVLCNFVYHRRFQESLNTFWSKCTHGSVLRALLDYVLLAIGSEGKASFGNAPLQSCQWKKVLDETGASAVLDFYNGQGATVEARDLRLLVAEQDILGRPLEKVRRDEAQESVEIDLRGDSLLDNSHNGIGNPHFRVMDYDPRRTETFHANGSHRYVINRAVLYSDVVISLPKLKTHEKVGITCNIKGFVGAVGHKDCLAHHRFGSPQLGGDEYPTNSKVRHLVSTYHEWLQKRDSSLNFQAPLQVIDKSLKRILKRTGSIPSGAWHGNDTAWRMALDLARIMHYADSTGQMQTTLQRRHLSLIDGIIAGEGDGPLSPTPVNSGVLLFSDNVAVADLIAARLMGFEPNAIPIVREAFTKSKFPLFESSITEQVICRNGRPLTVEEVRPVLSRQFLPPRGWREHFQQYT
jgi:uncharacterized protein (DUF362 family)